MSCNHLLPIWQASAAAKSLSERAADTERAAASLMAEVTDMGEGVDDGVTAALEALSHEKVQLAEAERQSTEAEAARSRAFEEQRMLHHQLAEAERAHREAEAAAAQGDEEGGVEDAKVPISQNPPTLLSALPRVLCQHAQSAGDSFSSHQAPPRRVSASLPLACSRRRRRSQLLRRSTRSACLPLSRLAASITNLLN